MAGAIFFLDGPPWSHSSSVFYWAVETLAERTSSLELKTHLLSISQNHLGSLSLNRFPPNQQDELIELIRRLPGIAQATLPTWPERDDFIAQIVELATRVA